MGIILNKVIHLKILVNINYSCNILYNILIEGAYLDIIDSYYLAKSKSTLIILDDVSFLEVRNAWDTAIKNNYVSMIMNYEEYEFILGQYNI